MEKIKILTGIKGIEDILKFELLNQKLQKQDKCGFNACLKRNWYFPISATAFFCLNVRLTTTYIIGLMIAVGIAVLVSAQCPSVWLYTTVHSKKIRILSLATAVGICLSGQAGFCASLRFSSKAQALAEMFPSIFEVASVVGAVVGCFFAYFWILVFWERIIELLGKTKIFDEIKMAEWTIYIVLLFASLVFMTDVFAHSQAFYGTEVSSLSYDIIYTSDSQSLVLGNVYLALAHPENDLRQPLFAVFAAPFIGAPYLIARLLGASAGVQAVIVNAVQIVMLFLANLILAMMMKLDALKRICFMVLVPVTYVQILSVLMMEQYIISYFWMAFCMYFIVENKKSNRIALWGAGGTLLTSTILMPFMSGLSPSKSFKAWFFDMVKYGFEFVALMLIFCRIDVIFELIPKIRYLSMFTGKEILFADKMCQFTEFICNCFAAPSAGVNVVAGKASWQLNTVSSVNFAGVFILFLVVVSAVLNRNKKSSQLSASWVGLSVFMLLILGWGTAENGLILYALYFGWAFLVLLFQLVEKIEDWLHVRFLIPLGSVITVTGLLAVNIPAIMEMVNFAITYYPV